MYATSGASGVLSANILALSKDHFSFPDERVKSPPSCGVGKTTTSDPNIFSARGVSWCDLKNAPLSEELNGYINIEQK